MNRRQHSLLASTKKGNALPSPPTCARRFWRALGLLFVIAALGIGRSAYAQAPIQTGPITLPKNTILPMKMSMGRWNGLPIVQGMLHETEQVRCVLDTGLNGCALLPAYQTALQMPAGTNRVRLNILDRAVETTDTRIKTLNLGLLQIIDFPVALADVFSALSTTVRVDSPAVWLGYPFLSTFQTTFDFVERSIYFEPTTAKLPKEPETVLIPLIVKDGRIWAKVSLPGCKPFTALVDTGTEGTLIPSEIAQRLKAKSLQVFTMSRFGKSAKAALVLLPEVKVGTASVKEVRAIALAPDAPKEFDSTFAILGLDFLRHFKVTINYAKKQMALTPVVQPDDTAPEGAFNGLASGVVNTSY